jgi:hypothetical protein
MDGGLRWVTPDDSEIYRYRVDQLRCTDGREELARVGQMLLDQNARSVNDRYREDNAYVYAYARPQHTWLPVHVLGAISCYEYQACESPDWRDTEAKAFCDALRDKMIHRLPGYDAGPWAIGAASVPPHVADARKAAEHRQVELRREQDARVAAANAALAAGVTELPGERIATVTTLPRATSDPADDRNATIKAIRTALRCRSGKAWSVRGGRGTAWGWIYITAPPARTDEYGGMPPEDAAELGRLLGLDGAAHSQGVSIAASRDYRREYIARAEGRKPEVRGVPYWD